VYDLICVQDNKLAQTKVDFFVKHFGFDKKWTEQVREKAIPKEQAILFIQDLLHID